MNNNKVGAGWIKQGKENKYLSLQLEIDGKKYYFTMFKNSYKTEDKHPDYVIYESRKKSDTVDTDDISF